MKLRLFSNANRENQIIAKPDYLFIELTNRCNMNCVFCPSSVLKKTRQDANDANVLKFLKQIRKLKIKAPVHFNVLGEPLLNKKILKYINICDRMGNDVILITNITMLNEKTAKKILKHSNVVLVLSYQTPTEKSYKMRNFKMLTFQEYTNIVFKVIELKYKIGSKARIELHIASDFDIYDNSMQLDDDVKLWGGKILGENPQELVDSFIDRLSLFSDEIRKKYDNNCQKEYKASLKKYDYSFKDNTIIEDREKLPKDFYMLPEQDFWGYMFLPNTFLRFKNFGLWTKKSSFLKKVFPEDKFIFVEECLEHSSCPISNNIAMLADGTITCCCLDYEGEMNLGNIENDNLKDILNSEKRMSIINEATSQELCRKCKGNVFVFDTDELACNRQKVDKYGRGWYSFEKDLYNCGGRWSQNNAFSYIYTRIDATKLLIDFYTIFEEKTEYNLKIYTYDINSKSFTQNEVFNFKGKKESICNTMIEFKFEKFKFYRLEICSPVFCPNSLWQTDDKRNLGIAVFNMELQE